MEPYKITLQLEIDRLNHLVSNQERIISQLASSYKDTLKDYRWLFNNCELGEITHSDFFNINVNAFTAADAEIAAADNWLNRSDIVKQMAEDHFQGPYSNPDTL